MSDSHVLFFAASGEVTEHSVDDLNDLLARDDGWFWIDVPEPDDTFTAQVGDKVGLHPKTVQAILTRNHVARVHTHEGRMFVVLHKPFRGASGHVHYLELNIIAGPKYVITTHGPKNPSVSLETLVEDTEAIRHRVLSGRIKPATPVALSGAIVSAMCRDIESMVNTLAQEVGQLEQRVMFRADNEKPQAFLVELFGTRHALLTIHTMASQATEIFVRAAHLLPDWSKADHKVLGDVRDQYQRLARISAAQLQFLEGVTEYYRARTDTKMAFAAERLAVIAAVTLPVTAISSVLGMNVIVYDGFRPVELSILLGLMAVLSIVLLIWTKRQGWW